MWKLTKSRTWNLGQEVGVPTRSSTDNRTSSYLFSLKVKSDPPTMVNVKATDYLDTRCLPTIDDSSNALVNWRLFCSIPLLFSSILWTLDTSKFEWIVTEHTNYIKGEAEVPGQNAIKLSKGNKTRSDIPGSSQPEWLTRNYEDELKDSICKIFPANKTAFWTKCHCVC